MIKTKLRKIKKPKHSETMGLGSHISGFILIIIISTVIIPQAMARQPDYLFKSLVDIDPESPWQIEADEIFYDDQSFRYIAKGSVTLTKRDKKLSADYISFDYKNMKAYAKGKVSLAVGEDTLAGSSMDIDLEKQTGTIENGTFFIKENNFYIKGSKIEKLGKNTYSVENTRVTTCEGENPDWVITGKSAKVTLEGYGHVWHAALWAKKVPVVYTPFLVFPAKTKRQSGFLFPEIGHSDRWGGYFIQPFFWAIGESSDATFYEHHMHFRGDKLGLEYRYVLSEKSKGTVMYDYLNDRKIDDGTLDSSKEWGYQHDDELRPNHHRYWFRMSHHQAMPAEFFAKLDLDILSDQDYLLEFEDGLTGFNQTEKYFNKNFGREFDEYDDPVRTNRLNLTRNWTRYSFNAETLWYDDIIKRRWEDTDTTIQKLPFIGFDGSKQPVLKSPLYFSLDSEYTYFYSEDGQRGHRADLYPRFYIPYRFKNIFSFEPSAGVRETGWYMDRKETGEDYLSEEKKRFNRQIYDIKLDFSSEIYKVYDGSIFGTSGIKHSVTPQVIYEYIPDQDQDEFPDFDVDSIDRIEKKNQLTYSITSTFTSRSKKSVLKSDDIPRIENDGPMAYNYRQFLWFKLEQSYDFYEAREDDPLKWENQTDQRPFSPLKGELEFYPLKYLSFEGDAEWCQYDDEFLSYNAKMSLSDNRNDRLYVEYRYSKDAIKSIVADLTLKITDSLTTYGGYERNILDDQRIKTSVGIKYQAQCWSVGIGYTDEPDDRKYEFSINLYGLGEVGN
ncbi:MAG: LPS assembly protein LptD [Thermodesulfobacteriota bacterium]|nr:LPS assembly protein LptD [Thermodesulfobacteriota bacterium]